MMKSLTIDSITLQTILVKMTGLQLDNSFCYFFCKLQQYLLTCSLRVAIAGLCLFYTKFQRVAYFERLYHFVPYFIVRVLQQ